LRPLIALSLCLPACNSALSIPNEADLAPANDLAPAIDLTPPAEAPDLTAPASADLAVPPIADFPACGLANTAPCNFGAPIALGSPSSPDQVFAGDVDGDGKQDIVILGGPFAGALLGNGDGTFRSQRDTHVDGRESAAAGDLDGDGKLDLVVVGSSLTIWLGQSDGSFSRGASIAPIDYADRVLLADFNGDGKLDAVTFSGFYGASGALFLATSGPSFGAPTPLGGFGGPNDWPVSDVVAADVDGDGDMDLVSAAYTSDGNGELTVQFGDGKGGFTAATFDVAAFSFCLVAQDFNGDGKADVVMHLKGKSWMWISQGRTFKPVITTDSPFSLEPDSAIAADFDGDGKLDYVVDGYPSVWVMSGDGAGGLADPVEHASPVSGFGHSLAAADFNGDGAAEVASLQTPSAAISSKNGDYTIPAAVYTAADLDAVAAGDFNSDGRQDLISFGNSSRTLTASFQQADGSFSPLRVIASGGGPRSRAAVVAGDFDHDGHLDALIPGALLMGNGDGSFRPSPSPSPGSPLVAGDFNEDGWADVVYQVGLDTHLALSDTTGPFKRALALPVANFTPELVVDLNGDGHADLVGTVPITHALDLIVLLGAGDGTFTWSFSDAQLKPGGPVVGDFDGDRIPDLIAASFYHGNGDGTFVKGAPAPFDVLSAGDFDHDGVLDVAGLSPLRTLATAAGNGDGTFGMPVGFGPLPFSYTGVFSADIDGNGRPDLVTFGAGALQVLLDIR
jgi:hypothetical protein